MSVALLGVVVLSAGSLGTNSPRASTDCGDAEGVAVIDPQSGVPLHIWRDIPFGNASRRWLPPKAPTCWAPAVYNASTRRGICWQLHGAPRPPSTPQQQREDCLTLDVVVNAQATSAGHSHNAQPLPVIVWLYGGSLIAGSTDSCPGVNRLAALADVVLVMPNYRVGAHGFLSLPELDRRDPRGVSGNYGLLDQQLALQWVQSNIRAFGGDPTLVTLLGQSSGGTSILGLLASPGSRGLFHAAISLSASPNVSVSRRDAQAVFRNVVDAGTNCSNLTCLLSLPPLAVANLLPAEFDVTPQLPATPSGQHYPGLVVVDGVTVVDDVITALQRTIVDVPLILQTELAEMDTYENNGTINAMGRAQYRAFLTNWFDQHNFSSGAGKAEEVLELYEAEFVEGTGSAELPYQVFLAEYSFLCGNVALAKTAASTFSSPVYASIGVHPPCHPFQVFPAPSASSRYAGHNWDMIAAVQAWE